MEKRVLVITNEPESAEIITQYFAQASVAFDVKTPEQSEKSMEALFQQLSGAEESKLLADTYTEVLVLVNSNKCEPLDYRELGDFPVRLVYLNFEEGELVIQNAEAKTKKTRCPI